MLRLCVEKLFSQAKNGAQLHPPQPDCPQSDGPPPPHPRGRGPGWPRQVRLHSRRRHLPQRGHGHGQRCAFFQFFLSSFNFCLFFLFIFLSIIYFLSFIFPTAVMDMGKGALFVEIFFSFLGPHIEDMMTSIEWLVNGSPGNPGECLRLLTQNICQRSLTSSIVG